MKFSILALSLLLSLSTEAFEKKTDISCKSDFSSMEMGVMTIKINSSGGGLKATINGRKLKRNIKVTEYEIQPNMMFPIDPYSDEYDKLNFGEVSLNAIYSQDIELDEGDDELDFKTGIDFDVRNVSKMKVYDLIDSGRSEDNKFGGEILMEVFDSEGRLLGRLARFVITKVCL